jgi:hypothetical protein
MKRFMAMGLSIVIVLALFANISLVNSANALSSNEVKLLITKIGNKWKVVDVSDTTKTKIKVKKGQKITWTAQGTDAYFQFMDTELVGKFKHGLKDGKSISLKIGKKAKVGVNNYAVFCLTDFEFAEGGSPPEIIVE